MFGRAVPCGLVRTGGKLSVWGTESSTTDRTAAPRLFLNDRWTPPEVQAFLGHATPHITLTIYTIVKAENLPDHQPSPRLWYDVWSCCGVGHKAAALPAERERQNPQHLLGILMVGATGIEPVTSAV